jgi:hypothetical protein
MSKSRVTIVFECDSKFIQHPDYISALDLNTLVMRALYDQKLKVAVEELNNDPD